MKRSDSGGGDDDDDATVGGDDAAAQSLLGSGNFQHRSDGSSLLQYRGPQRRRKRDAAAAATAAAFRVGAADDAASAASTASAAADAAGVDGGDGVLRALSKRHGVAFVESPVHEYDVPAQARREPLEVTLAKLAVPAHGDSNDAVMQQQLLLRDRADATLPPLRALLAAPEDVSGATSGWKLDGAWPRFVRREVLRVLAMSGGAAEQRLLCDVVEGRGEFVTSAEPLRIAAVEAMHNLRNASDDTIAVLKGLSTAHEFGGNAMRHAAALMLGTLAHRLNDSSPGRGALLRAYVLERVIFAALESPDAVPLWQLSLGNAYDHDATMAFREVDKVRLTHLLRRKRYYLDEHPGYIVPEVMTTPAYEKRARATLREWLSEATPDTPFIARLQAVRQRRQARKHGERMPYGGDTFGGDVPDGEVFDEVHSVVKGECVELGNRSSCEICTGDGKKMVNKTATTKPCSKNYIATTTSTMTSTLPDEGDPCDTYDYEAGFTDFGSGGGVWTRRKRGAAAAAERRRKRGAVQVDGGDSGGGYLAAAPPNGTQPSRAVPGTEDCKGGARERIACVDKAGQPCGADCVSSRGETCTAITCSDCDNYTSVVDGHQCGRACRTALGRACPDPLAWFKEAFTNARVYSDFTPCCHCCSYHLCLFAHTCVFDDALRCGGVVLQLTGIQLAVMRGDRYYINHIQPSEGLSGLGVAIVRVRFNGAPLVRHCSA